MAAFDAFDDATGSLSAEEKERLKDVIKTTRGELLAARSEEARVRLVHEYIRTVHDLLMPAR
jgi:hypothetical protein